MEFVVCMGLPIGGCLTGDELVVRGPGGRSISRK
jgi:hypothetical protein